GGVGEQSRQVGDAVAEAAKTAEDVVVGGGVEDEQPPGDDGREDRSGDRAHRDATAPYADLPAVRGGCAGCYETGHGVRHGSVYSSSRRCSSLELAGAIDSSPAPVGARCVD